MPRPQPRSLARLARDPGAWLLALLASVAVLPGFLTGAAAGPGGRAASLLAVATPAGDAGGTAAAGSAADERRAWLLGRQAAWWAAADRVAAEQVARGSGATAAATTRAWVVPAGADLTIPPLVLRAYRAAAGWASGFDPGCRLSWSVLAGIGRIESNHGRYAGAATRFSVGGDVSPPILGPALDGRVGFAAIADSDGGRLDGDRIWDRAVGPMQFLPSTWRSLGRDGNGDRVADPGNLFDAAVSAGAYLCLGGGGDLSDPARLRQAVFGYNHSWSYVDTVLGWATFYAQRIGGGPGVLPPLSLAATVPGPPVTTGPAATPAPTTHPTSTTTTPPGTTPTTTPAGTTPTTTPPAGATPTTTPPAGATTGPVSATTPVTTTNLAPTTTLPCAPPTTTTTLPPGSTTTTTTTTLPPGSTTTTLPPCPTSTVGTSRP